MCSGPVRQQPPTTVAPAAIQDRAAVAQSFADTVPDQVLLPASKVSPEFG
jgi:hypothetical protein